MMAIIDVIRLGSVMDSSRMKGASMVCLKLEVFCRDSSYLIDRCSAR